MATQSEHSDVSQQHTSQCAKINQLKNNIVHPIMPHPASPGCINSVATSKSSSNDANAIAAAAPSQTSNATGNSTEKSPTQKPKNKKRKLTVEKIDSPLFAFNVSQEGNNWERPKRRIKSIPRFDPTFVKETKSKQSCKIGEGFTCPQCASICSYDSKQCYSCQLECCYEAGIGVVVIHSRRISYNKILNNRSPVKVKKKLETQVEKQIQVQVASVKKGGPSSLNDNVPKFDQSFNNNDSKLSSSKKGIKNEVIKQRSEGEKNNAEQCLVHNEQQISNKVVDAVEAALNSKVPLSTLRNSKRDMIRKQANLKFASRIWQPIKSLLHLAIDAKENGEDVDRACLLRLYASLTDTTTSAITESTKVTKQKEDSNTKKDMRVDNVAEKSAKSTGRPPNKVQQQPPRGSREMRRSISDTISADNNGMNSTTSGYSSDVDSTFATSNGTSLTSSGSVPISDKEDQSQQVDAQVSEADIKFCRDMKEQLLTMHSTHDALFTTVNVVEEELRGSLSKLEAAILQRNQNAGVLNKTFAESSAKIALIRNQVTILTAERDVFVKKVQAKGLPISSVTPNYSTKIDALQTKTVQLIKEFDAANGRVNDVMLGSSSEVLKQEKERSAVELKEVETKYGQRLEQCHKETEHLKWQLSEAASKISHLSNEKGLLAQKMSSTLVAAEAKEKRRSEAQANKISQLESTIAAIKRENKILIKKQRVHKALS